MAMVLIILLFVFGFAFVAGLVGYVRNDSVLKACVRAFSVALLPPLIFAIYIGVKILQSQDAQNVLDFLALLIALGWILLVAMFGASAGLLAGYWARSRSTRVNAHTKRKS